MAFITTWVTISTVLGVSVMRDSDGNIEYENVFRKKWGDELTKIFIERNNFLDILETKNLMDLYKMNKFTELIKKL